MLSNNHQRSCYSFNFI